MSILTKGANVFCSFCYVMIPGSKYLLPPTSCDRNKFSFIHQFVSNLSIGGTDVLCVTFSYILNFTERGKKGHKYAKTNEM